jgi:hypothetical protein
MPCWLSERAVNEVVGNFCRGVCAEHKRDFGGVEHCLHRSKIPRQQVAQLALRSDSEVN